MSGECDLCGEHTLHCECNDPVWIKVSNRLPEPDINVLAVDIDGNINVAFRTELDSGLEWTYYDYLPWEYVTHWMPLQAPPEE